MMGNYRGAVRGDVLKLQLVKGDAIAVHTKISLDAIEQPLLVQCTHRKRTTERNIKTAFEPQSRVVSILNVYLCLPLGLLGSSFVIQDSST